MQAGNKAVLPDGPGNIRELMAWPQDIVAVALRDPDRRQRLESIMADGVVVSTDYSGQQTPEFVLRYVWNACAEQGIQMPRHSLRFYRACDVSRVCQQVMLTNQVSEHIFGELVERVPAAHAEALRRLQPKSSANADEAGQAYREVAAYLHEHRAECFNGESCSHCLVHKGQECLVSPSCDSADSRQGSGPRPLKINIAGAMCTPWSAFGLGKKLCDPATTAWHIYSMERATLGEDILCLENAPEFPVQLLRDLWGSTHEVIAAVFGPDLLGWPVRRERMLSWCLKRGSLAWVGPTDGDAIHAEFRAMFGATIKVDGDIFAGLDSDEHMHEALTDLARLRRCYVRQDCALADSDVARLLSTSSRDHFLKYQDLFDKMQSNPQTRKTAWIADLSQDPSHRCRAGEHLMTAMKNSTYYSFSKRRFLTTREVCVAHGWPAIPGLATIAPPASMSQGILSNCQRRVLTGNSMHLACVAAWFAFCLSKTVRTTLIDGSSDDLVTLSMAWVNEAWRGEEVAPREGKDESARKRQREGGSAAT